MAHAFVPSNNDLRASTIENIVKTIEDQKIYDEAHKVLDRLKEDIDEETIIFKLISMILDKQDIKGPSNIGIPADKLDAILARAAQRGGGKSRGRGNYRGNRNRSGGGGNSSGGGGGYRGKREGGNREGGGGYRGNKPRSNQNRHRD
jgi:ATP-dependent RNA helicase DeaD